MNARSVFNRMAGWPALLLGLWSLPGLGIGFLLVSLGGWTGDDPQPLAEQLRARFLVAGLLAADLALLIFSFLLVLNRSGRWIYFGFFSALLIFSILSIYVR